MPSVIGGRAIRALERIATELALDYGGIDFGIGPDGEVLLFEANATMVNGLRPVRIRDGIIGVPP